MLPKVIYRFKQSLSKSQWYFCTEIHKIHMAPQKNSSSQNNLEQKEQCCRIHFLVSKYIIKL
jgi:hypothetical protein